MPDITMCSGVGCPWKERCYRHTAIASNWQSWFSVVPWDGVGCVHAILDVGSKSKAERLATLGERNEDVT